jgi:putative phosphonate transport system ATP-binding protein
MISFENQIILSVHHLNKQFGLGCADCNNADNNVLLKNYCPHCGTIYACKDVSFNVYEGEILGLVGESGSGKSTLMDCLYFDIETTSGKAFINAYKRGAENIFDQTAQEKRSIRNQVLGKVYQNPSRGLKMDFSSLANIAEKMIAAGYRNVSVMEKRATHLLNHVDIPSYRMKDAPRNFSGGMQQRVQIARAMSNYPPLLLLDEVTTGLDLSVQASVLDLIKLIQRDLNVSMILVSHDLRIVRMLAERTIVMLEGKIIEQGLTDQILEDPQHSYTQQLVQSLI